MNILVLSWRGPKHPNAGGAEQVMHEHMKGWVKSGHTVYLFTASYEGAKRAEDVNGIKVIRKSFQYVGVQAAACYWYLFGKHIKFDLVVDQFHGIPFFTPFYVRVKKLAVIQETAREVWFQNHFAWPMNWLIGGTGYLGEPFIFLFYRGIHFLTGSASAKEDVVKFGIPEKNITIVPHGVILAHPKNPKQKAKIKTIVYLGALTKDKGVEDAVKCFSLLKKEGDYQFWIVGRGSREYTKKLKDLARKLGVERDLKFWGFVDDKRKFELLMQAHVLINPSVREGWGLVNIEANSVHTPIVAYKSAGLVDSVKDGQSGLLCEENTPESLAKNISSLLKDKEQYEKLQNGAKKWSERFSWEKSLRKSLKLISSFED